MSGNTPNYQATTTVPGTGKIYRVTAPKVRTSAFIALKSAEVAAKDALASFMRLNKLAHDLTRKITIAVDTGEPPNAEVKTEVDRLLAAVKAAQLAIKAYKIAHPGEFVPQVNKKSKGVPTVNRPIGSGSNS